MTEAFASNRHNAAVGAIRVVAPQLGDMLSGALHTAYDDPRQMPDDFAVLLARLDRVERLTN